MGLKQCKKVRGTEWNKEQPINQQKLLIPSIDVRQNGKCDFNCSGEKSRGWRDKGMKRWRYGFFFETPLKIYWGHNYCCISHSTKRRDFLFVLFLFLKPVSRMIGGNDCATGIIAGGIGGLINKKKNTCNGKTKGSTLLSPFWRLIYLWAQTK